MNKFWALAYGALSIVFILAMIYAIAVNRDVASGGLLLLAAVFCALIGYVNRKASA